MLIVLALKKGKEEIRMSKRIKVEKSQMSPLFVTKETLISWSGRVRALLLSFKTQV